MMYVNKNYSTNQQSRFICSYIFDFRYAGLMLTWFRNGNR